MPLWWNWQTRGTQNPVVAIPCRFDPDQRHHNKKRQVFACLFLTSSLVSSLYLEFIKFRALEVCRNVGIYLQRRVYV